MWLFLFLKGWFEWSLRIKCILMILQIPLCLSTHIIEGKLEMAERNTKKLGAFITYFCTYADSDIDFI